MNEEFENIDSLNDEVGPLDQETETQPVDVEKVKEINKRLFERAKRAEQELKVLKSQPKPEQKENLTNNPQFVTKEELEKDLLRTAKGYDDDTMDQLSAIAKGKGLSMLQAEKDPLFSLVLAQKEAEAKEARARLGASQGSSAHEAPSISGMSREDHMKLVKERTRS